MRMKIFYNMTEEFQMKKRILALTLALLLVLLSAGIMSACGGESRGTDDDGGGKPAVDTTEALTSAETTDYLASLPNTDLSGMELRILGVDYDTRRNFPLESENGELVNDALYARNRAVEERHNVTISCTSEASDGPVNTKVKASVSAGDDAYDIIISTISGSMADLGTGKCLYNLLDVPYIALEEGWWSREFAANLTLGGKLYYTLSDFAPMKFYAPYVMCFNSKLAADRNLGDIYGMVIDGKWTNDVLSKMTKDVAYDLDGDGEMTSADFWAYAHVKTAITTYAHYTGSGMQLNTLDGGLPVVELDTDKSVKVIEAISQYLGSDCIAYKDMAETYNMFVEGRALFFGNSTSNVIAYFRSMEDDFGIIPVPKYDESQEKYYSYINTWVRGGVGVPATCTKIEEVGLLLEVLSYMSYGEVRDALFETTMKQKVARDDTAGVILDMVFDNSYIDLNGVYDFGGSASTIYKAVMEGAEFMSGYAAAKDKISAAVDKLIEQMS